MKLTIYSLSFACSLLFITMILLSSMNHLSMTGVEAQRRRGIRNYGYTYQFSISNGGGGRSGGSSYRRRYRNNWYGRNQYRRFQYRG